MEAGIKKEEYCFGAYALFQFLLLVALRKFYLLTVYQTAVFYLAVSLAGLFFLYYGKKSGRAAFIRDIYFLLWSSFHGIIVLGFLTTGTFYLTLTQLTWVQVINAFLGFAVYWFFYLITGQCGTAVAIGNVILLLTGYVNHYLVRFRGAPFQVSDLKAMKTAENVAANYDYTPDLYMAAAIFDMVLWAVLLFRAVRKPEGGRQFRTVGKIGISILTAAGCAVLVFGSYREVYKNIGQFSKDSYLADLLADVLGSTVSCPEDYSAEYVQTLLDEFAPQEQTDEIKPNIVVIMNEAFSDLRVLGDLNTDVPVLGFWDSCTENCIKGFVNVSVFGGTTANSEYEFLTSDAVVLYNSSIIPYQNFFDGSESYPGLCSILKQQGYETTAFHPYLSSGWNRPAVYREMQFDHIIFSEDLEEELDKMRLYVSDKGDYEYIRQWFEKKEKGVPQFFFNVTMQNHSGYTYKGDDFKTEVQLPDEAAGRFPQAEQYLSLIKASDEALSNLLSYFAQYEEPVIVVMFGDHQPSLETGFYEYLAGAPSEEWTLEQRSCLYKTPFLIWHNYAAKSTDIGDISLNYLAPFLLADAGLSMSSYQQYLFTCYQELPVVAGSGVRDKDGIFYSWGAMTEEIDRRLNDMRLCAYNHTVDRENRAKHVFEYVP